MEHGGGRSLQGPIRRQYETQGHLLLRHRRPVGRRRDRPADTRRVLALGLSAANAQPIEDVKFGVFRM